MHSAPSVSYPVGRSRIGAMIFWAIWAAGALSVGTYCYQNNSIDWRAAVMLGALLPGVAAGVWMQRGTEPRLLAWDGAAWGLSGRQPLSMASAFVALDLQRALLLQLGASGQPRRWVWLEHAAQPERWSALRRAVYCRASDPVAEGAAIADGRLAPRLPHPPA